MRFPILAIATATSMGMATLAMAQAGRPFTYEPLPRWAEDPETEEVCRAVAAECAARFPGGEIDASWGYAEFYDADGYLVGLKTLASTGCRPLDEHLLLSHRQFRGAFSKDGVPELEDVAVELKPGTPKDAVRLVKKGETQVGIGC